MLVYKNHRDYSAIQTSNFEWVNPPLPPKKKPKTEAVNTFSQIDEYLQVTTNIQNNVYWTDWITTNMKNCWTIFLHATLYQGEYKRNATPNELWKHGLLYCIEHVATAWLNSRIK